ncbi:uncharacterized protein LOC128232406 [Mya arenaria]|uniref:uncharacterized protein LOC128232406 n=1 Tax=Mya arenaria TaxID=6604 RepID=UPI0022E32A5A|nr:uncharacterized protein LOC128232406 [Mya arenaria]
MRLVFPLILCVLWSSTANGNTPCGDGRECPSSFTYCLNNHLIRPFFKKTIKMKIKDDKPFLYYMQQAVEKDNKNFRNFTATYYKKLGYFIEGVNGLMGNWKDNRTYWEFSNATFGPLNVGVSYYTPSPGDKVLLNFTMGAKQGLRNTRTYNGRDPAKF